MLTSATRRRQRCSLHGDGIRGGDDALPRRDPLPRNSGVSAAAWPDLAEGASRLVVRVDGAVVGTWASAERNPTLRFADLDSEIPARFTRGREAIDVEIDAALLTGALDGLRLRDVEPPRALIAAAREDAWRLSRAFDKEGAPFSDEHGRSQHVTDEEFEAVVKSPPF